MTSRRNKANALVRQYIKHFFLSVCRKIYNAIAWNKVIGLRTYGRTVIYTMK